MKNYYEILGLNPDAPQSAVKPAAQAKANEINEAFRILNDPEQRKAYDAWLTSYAGSTASPQSNNSDSQADTVAVETYYATAKNTDSKATSGSSTSFVTAPSMRSNAKSNATTATLAIKPFMRGVLEKFTYIEVSSFRDVVIFVAALAFFLYMLLSFLGPTPIPPPPENSPLTLSQQRG